MKKICHILFLLVVCFSFFLMGCKKNDQAGSEYTGKFDGKFLDQAGNTSTAKVNVVTGKRFGSIIVTVVAANSSDSPKYTVNGAINGPTLFINKNDLKKTPGIRYQYNGAGVVVKDTLYLDIYEAYLISTIKDALKPTDTTWTEDKTKAKKWEFTGPRAK